MYDPKLKNICLDLCRNLCNDLTIIKGFFDLSEQQTEIKYSSEIRKGIKDMELTIKDCIDEINHSDFTHE